MTLSFGYLGPEATFTEAALIQLLTAHDRMDAARRPMRSADAALAAVAAGELTGAVVPIENSLEGGVPATLDALTQHGQLQIVAETVVRVRFVLAAAPGTELAQVTAFSTHPHAEAQTRAWLTEHLPEAHYIPAASTAAAARDLPESDVDYQAAICPALAAERYGLTVLADDIGDRKDADTRFVLVSTKRELPAPTGADKTTLVAALASDRAGALLELLEQFSTRGVNLSRIESRPTGDGLGLYQFSIDAQGHVAEPRMAEALTGVHRIARRLQFLGSYPSADGEKVIVDPDMTAQAFTAAADWLAEIRG